MTLTSSWIVRNWLWRNFKKNWKKGTKLTEKLTILICFDGFCCYSFKKSHPGYSMFNCSKIHSSVIHTKIITWINFQKMRWSHCAQNLFFRISLNTNFSCWNIAETIQILFFILFVWYFGENYKRKSLINAFINSYRKLSTQTHTHTHQFILMNWLCCEKNTNNEMNKWPRAHQKSNKRSQIKWNSTR